VIPRVESHRHGRACGLAFAPLGHRALLRAGMTRPGITTIRRIIVDARTDKAGDP
jgi:hypothetical protein